MAKKSCYTCSSFSVIKWGFQNGKQRYQCKSCGQFFIWRNEGKRYDQFFTWFEQWVFGKQTLDQLAIRSKYCWLQLQRYFNQYLESPPVFAIPQKKEYT